MPNYFTLTKIGEDKPKKFADIDAEMRTEFGEPQDDVNWLWHWYDIIGLRLALGQSLDDMLSSEDETARLHDEGLRKIAEYLKVHYKSDAWAEIGKR